ncbi:MAG: sporulation protein YqfD [Oscillospiraceae bacterium]|nr:sporulation protein YqfD [Oscillospiraceae bacterium]
MFNKFFKFLLGYVIIRIYGKGAERFLNICLRRGIPVWNVLPRENGLEMSVSIDGFLKLRPVAKKCGVKVRIKEKHGLIYKIRAYRKRYVFLASVILAICICAASTRFIWLVEINGVENSDINSIMETLDRIGVRSGALKSKLPEGMEIKKAIINDTDNIAWAWVYIEGAKARVEIYEQIIAPNVIDKKTPCDIVAACDGVIKKMTVKNGEKKLKEGDAVSAGDVIVSGKVGVYKAEKPEEYIYVHSMAEVEAYTTHKKSGEYKLYYETRTPTGKNKRCFAVEFLGKAFNFPFSKVKYDEYDTEERRHELSVPFFGYTGIALDVIEYDEVTVNREPLSIETAVEFAKNDLEEKISSNLTPLSELTDENIEYEKTDNETIKVTLSMKFIQNIATEQPLSGE